MKTLIIPILLISSYNCSAEDINNTYLNTVIEDTNKYRKSIHKSLVKASSDIDYYFDNTKRDINEYSDTYGLVQLSAYQNQHGSIKFDQKVKVKLKLPKLKENFKLVFESDEIRENVDHIEDHTQNNNDDFNLALAYNQLFGDTIDFKTKVGVKLKTKIDPFVKIEAKNTWYDVNSIDYTISQSFKQSVIEKLESISYLRLDKNINDIFSIHNYNEYYWHSPQKEDTEFYNSIYLNHYVSDRSHLTYTFGVNTNNIDSNLKVKRYSVKAKYRHFLKKWLYVDTVPENYYNEDLNFKPRYAIRFNLGIYFNKGSYN